MEEKETTLKDRVSVKDNPRTSIIGHILCGLATIMVIIKWILPVFMVLKQEPPFGWAVILSVGGVGLLFLYMTDEYFGRIFNRTDKAAAKITGTDDKKE